MALWLNLGTTPRGGSFKTRTKCGHEIGKYQPEALQNDSWLKILTEWVQLSDILILVQCAALNWGFPKMVVPNNHGFSY